MAASIQVTQAQLNTSTGAQAITISGFGTPKGCIALWSTATSRNALNNDASLGIGFADGTRDVSMSIWCDDSQGTTDTKRIDGANFIEGRRTVADTFAASFTSFTADTVNINISDAPSTGVWVTFIFIGGADTTNVYCDTGDFDRSTANDVTAPGFEPDVVFTASVSRPAVGAAEDGRFAIGVAVNDGSDTNAGWGVESDDAVGTANVTTYVSSTSCLPQVELGAMGHHYSIDTFDASGFTITGDDTISATKRVAYMALKFSNTTVSLANFSTPTTAGQDTIGGAVNTPIFSMAFIPNDGTRDAIQGTGQDGIGVLMHDGTGSYSVSWGDDHGATTTVCKSYVDSAGFTVLHDGSATLVDGSVVGHTTGGIILDYTTVQGTAQQAFVLFIEDPSIKLIANVFWLPPTGWNWVAFDGSMIPSDSILYHDDGGVEAANKIRDAQDETAYDNSPTTEGTFTGGTGYSVSDVITVTGGATVTVDAVSTGVVTQFTIDATTDAGNHSENDTLSQISVAPAGGTGFSLTIERDNIQKGTGSHDGADNASALTDSTAAWTTDEWIDYEVVNVTDGSKGLVTTNSATVVTATLAGGTEDDWDSTAPDNYLFQHPDRVTDLTKAWTVDEWTGFKIRNTSDGSEGLIAGNTATELKIGSTVVDAQDETAYDNTPATEGTFAGGTGHAVSDVITITGGATVTVDAVSAGVVTQFTVSNTGDTGVHARGDTLSQTATTGSGTGFSLTLDRDNVTQFMTGGTHNAWRSDNSYEIVVDIDINDQIVYEEATTNSGTVSNMSTKGVPTITGPSGNHSFDYKLRDITDSKVSATYTVTVTS